MSKRSVLLTYTASNIISKVLTGIGGILLARYFSKSDFGVLTTINSFLMIILILIQIGLPNYILLQASKNKDLLFELYTKALVAIVGLYFISSLSLPLYYFLYDGEGIDLYSILYVKAFIDILTLTFLNIYLQVTNRFLALSVLSMLAGLFSIASVLIVMYLKLTLFHYIVLSALLSGLATFILGGYFYKRQAWKMTLLWHEIHFSFDWSLVKKARTFFVSSIMIYIYTKSDILMLSWMQDFTEVARYGAVASIIFAAYLIPSSFYNYFLPKLTSSFHNNDLNKIRIILIEFCAITFMAVIPIFIFLYFFAEPFLEYIFTDKYSDSAKILQLLGIVFLFHSFCFITGAILTASDQQNIRTKIQLIAAVVNIVLNVIFIYLYAAEGAAFTTALCEVVIFSMYSYYSYKTLNARIKWSKE